MRAPRPTCPPITLRTPVRKSPLPAQSSRCVGRRSRAGMTGGSCLGGFKRLLQQEPDSILRARQATSPHEFRIGSGRVTMAWAVLSCLRVIVVEFPPQYSQFSEARAMDSRMNCPDRIESHRHWMTRSSWSPGWDECPHHNRRMLKGDTSPRVTAVAEG